LTRHEFAHDKTDPQQLPEKQHIQAAAQHHGAPSAAIAMTVAAWRPSLARKKTSGTE